MFFNKQLQKLAIGIIFANPRFGGKFEFNAFSQT
jgi:hypothetical protein